MPLQRHFAFRQERRRDASLEILPGRLSLTERFCLGETETEGDDQNGRACAKPV